ncbi:MAG: phosphatase PAP2 family protein [Croceibacterium sp.]
MAVSIPPIAVMVAAALGFAGFFVLDWLVKAGRTKAFDSRGIRALRRADGTPRIGMAWAPAMRGLTQLGGPVLRYLIALPCAAWLYHLGYRDTALWLVLTLGSGWIVDAAAKKIFKRQRPNLVPHLANAGGPSFPSGHTFNASLVYCGIALGLAPLLGTWLTPALAAAILLSFAVGFSRVWLGVHWPSDVFAGWMLGTAWWLGALALGSHWLGR